MNRDIFLNDPDVKDFIEWLNKNLPPLTICLKIKQSRFVPSSISTSVVGIDNVLPKYIWKSVGMQIGDWTETKLRLTALSRALTTAVSSGNNIAALDTCRDILAWGGNRNWAIGAYPFLNAMATAGTLCNYIAVCGGAFSLASADEAVLCPPIGLMNAMLTKVHALYATDGLPIYDSRVAAAIASLVELWRNNTNRSGTPLPSALAFPATMRSRTVLRLFPDASHPGIMTYGAPDTCAQWSSAKVRLGWIMESVLTQRPRLFSTCCPTPSLADRMHAFEASLFMIGYDVACLDCKLGGLAHSGYKKARTSLIPKTSSFSGAKIIRPLSGRGEDIEYIGSHTSGFQVHWGTIRFHLEPDFIAELQSEFGERHGVPLGANMTGEVSADSLGQWIVNEGWPSRRYVSAIAPVLHAEGVISSYKAGRGIALNF